VKLGIGKLFVRKFSIMKSRIEFIELWGKKILFSRLKLGVT
jgi:hypothetical protein